MNKCKYRSIPCPSIYCEERDKDLLHIYQAIDTPCVQICLESPVTETDAIECRPARMCISTVEEITRLQCCNLKLEKQLDRHIPNYLSKITNKSHVHYSGPVCAKEASIQYDECGNITMNYDFFYVPTC